MRNLNEAISRRRFLRRVMAAGVTIAVGQSWFDLVTRGSIHGGNQDKALAEASGPVAPAPICTDGRCLSPTELRILEALTAVVIPSDEQGPGAKEAGVAQQIHRAIAQADPVRQRYSDGLLAIDVLARRQHGEGFAELSDDKQSEVFAFLEEAYHKIWPQVPPTTFSGKVQWKLHLLYYRQIAGVSDPALVLFDQVVRDATEAFYSTTVAWGWLGYSGPPFPFGYVGRGGTCAVPA